VKKIGDLTQFPPRPLTFPPFLLLVLVFYPFSIHSFLRSQPKTLLSLPIKSSPYPSLDSQDLWKAGPSLVKPLSFYLPIQSFLSDAISLQETLFGAANPTNVSLTAIRPQHSFSTTPPLLLSSREEHDSTQTLSETRSRLSILRLFPLFVKSLRRARFHAYMDGLCHIQL